MSTIHRFAAAAAIILVVGAVSTLALANWGSGSGGIRPASAAPSASQASIASRAPSASPSASSPIDTSAWVAYGSNRYGFDISRPADWTVKPATRDWTFQEDATDFLSTAQEAFVAPNRDIRVSAWSVPLDPDTIESWADVEPWIASYCQKSGETPCTGIHDRGVPMCVERRDCHPALLVPFKEDVQAFATGGIFGGRMVVVAVWRPDIDPSVATYGGARRLLEAFLSTMGVYPPSGPDNHP